MQKFGLDRIDQNDLQAVQKIAYDLAGNKLILAGTILSMGNAKESAKLSYLSALVDQNWLIINQLSRINDAIYMLVDKQQ